MITSSLLGCKSHSTPFCHWWKEGTIIETRSWNWWGVTSSFGHSRHDVRPSASGLSPRLTSPRLQNVFCRSTVRTVVTLIHQSVVCSVLVPSQNYVAKESWKIEPLTWGTSNPGLTDWLWPTGEAKPNKLMVVTKTEWGGRERETRTYPKIFW